MKKNLKIKLALVLTILAIITASSVLAAYEFEIKLPAISGTQPSAGLAQYVRYLFMLGLGLGGVLAFASIVIAGIQMIMAGGNVGTVEDARSRLSQAILGLMLLLFSYLILRTINPQLTNLREPSFLPVVLPDETKTSSTQPLPPPERWDTVQGGATLVIPSSLTTVPDNLKTSDACSSAGGVCLIGPVSLSRLKNFRNEFRQKCLEVSGGTISCDFKVSSTIQGPGGPSVSTCHKPDGADKGTCADLVITQCQQSIGGNLDIHVCLSIMRATIESSANVRSCKNEYDYPSVHATGGHVHCNL